MSSQSIHAVTGALGYSGKYITQHLLDKGYSVITLTNSKNKSNPFGDKIKVFPLNFSNPVELEKSLQGVSVLYNTYWVRFDYKDFNHQQAVDNSLRLFNAAKNAGVQRIIHTSITNPSENSELSYFRGKAILEKAIISSGLSYSILRPAVLFGKEDILINNIAWSLRYFPFFPIFGDGNYKMQPIYVDDFAQLAVEEGQLTENRVIDAIGPEIFTYRELVESIGNIIGKPKPVISLPPNLVYIFGSILGFIKKDVMITKDEIKGLMDNLLFVNSPPVGKTKLTDWAMEHSIELGKKYASELARRR